MSDTIKIRIAVAVADDGTYSAVGYGMYEMDERDRKGHVQAALQYLDTVEPSHRIVWVEAEIPVGETVAGEVVA